MRNPFKSKYYFRIIDKIAEMENKKEDAENWLKKHTSKDKYWPYYQFKHSRLQEEIVLLRAVLKAKLINT